MASAPGGTPATAMSMRRTSSRNLGVASAQRSPQHTSMVLTGVRDHLSLVLAAAWAARTAVRSIDFSRRYVSPLSHLRASRAEV